jgi:hypothetical protein
MGRKTGAQERHFCEQKEPGGRCGKKIDLMGDLALAMFNPRFNGGFLDGFLKERSASC